MKPFEDHAFTREGLSSGIKARRFEPCDVFDLRLQCRGSCYLSSRLRSRLSRRRFLKQVSLAGLASSAPAGVLSAVAGAVRAPSEPFRQAATKNRTPLARSAFYPLPPAGWLRAQLQLQADGLSGHLDETWPDVGPNSGWLGGSGESWERGPYFLDGLTPLAYLLDDARLKAKAQKYIDWTLDNQSANGMFGPRSNDDWWPRIVMLKVLTQYQEATGDPRVIPLMQRYFQYQLAELPKRPLRDWGKFRWQDEALSVFWLYNRTGDPKAAGPGKHAAYAGVRLDRAVREFQIQRAHYARVHPSWKREAG
jgi:hypothetical protein